MSLLGTAEESLLGDVYFLVTELDFEDSWVESARESAFESSTELLEESTSESDTT